ncbi:MlaD family protein [soil metagenome]
MTHADPPDGSSDPVADPVIEEGRASESRRRISLVWLVPLAALAISLMVAWQTYSQRGPLIEVVFDDAAGLVAGQTQLRFRNLNIGLVETLQFSSDLRTVVASIRVSRDLARFLDDSSRFWVVRPQVTTQGVTGIETVLSGVYIEVYFDTETGPTPGRFVALASAPLTPADQPGLRVRLRAPDGGSVNVGAPVIFKRIAVGTIEAVELTEAGDVVVDLFVDAPDHLRLSTATRFWNVSGFNIEIGTGGAQLNVDSLLTLVQGGIAFDTVTTGGEAVAMNHVYQLYSGENAARQSVVEEDPANLVGLSVFFDGSLRGLAAGSPVELRGVRVGEVTGIQTLLQSNDEGGPVASTRTVIELSPARFGLTGSDLRERLLDLFEQRVPAGMRAQIASANILTGALIVDLVEDPDAPPAEFERGAEPYPVLPSLPAETAGFAASAEGVLDRVAGLPIEEILAGVVALIANVNTLVTDERIRAAPENFGLLLADMRGLVGSEEIQQAPAELSAPLASVRPVVDDAAEARLVANLSLALAEASRAAENVGSASEGLPVLIDSLNDLARRTAELPLDELVRSTAGLVEGVEDFLVVEGMDALPTELARALAEVQLLLADLRGGGAVDSLNAALASTEDAAAAVQSAMASLPALVQQLSAVAGRADQALATVSPGSEINRDTLLLLREVRDSARAVNSLVSALERRPNSVLFGR